MTKEKHYCIYCGKRIKRKKCKCMKRELKRLAKEIRLERETKYLGKKKYIQKTSKKEV